MKNRNLRTMKKQILLLISFTIFLASCGNNAEVEQLKKENALLVQQINALKTGTTGKPVKYILKLRLKQSHFSLSIKKHIKDAVNSIDFELPVDKEFYDSVNEGDEIVDKFRFGSFILSGSFGDWEMKVKAKEVR
jgi:PBP1b-binding outer membrane lipoprotein LpoB